MKKTDEQMDDLGGFPAIFKNIHIILPGRPIPGIR